jgi:hypothetical protein
VMPKVISLIAGQTVYSVTCLNESGLMSPHWARLFNKGSEMVQMCGVGFRAAERICSSMNNQASILICWLCLLNTPGLQVSVQL